MGGVKKAIKKVGNAVSKVFGGGSSESAPAVQTVDTTPIQQAVTNQDVSLASDAIENKNRNKKNGARGLNTASDIGNSIAGGATSDDKRNITGA